MGIEKTRNCLKNTDLVAVTFDKGIGFCVMKKHTYEEKLYQLLEYEQFERHDKIIDSVAQKFQEKHEQRTTGDEPKV